jgi:hypothetical protein
MFYGDTAKTIAGLDGKWDMNDTTVVNTTFEHETAGSVPMKLTPEKLTDSEYDYKVTAELTFTEDGESYIFKIDILVRDNDTTKRLLLLEYDEEDSTALTGGGIMAELDKTNKKIKFEFLNGNDHTVITLGNLDSDYALQSTSTVAYMQDKEYYMSGTVDSIKFWNNDQDSRGLRGLTIVADSTMQPYGFNSGAVLDNSTEPFSAITATTTWADNSATTFYVPDGNDANLPIMDENTTPISLD